MVVVEVWVARVSGEITESDEDTTTVFVVEGRLEHTADASQPCQPIDPHLEICLELQEEHC